MIDKFDGKEVKNWQPYVGKRCIVIEDRYGGWSLEVEVLEVSPRGRVKFRFPSKFEGWQDNE